MTLEEEEERLVVPGTIGLKRGRTRTTHIWSHIHVHSAEFFIIRRESFIFFSEMGCMFLQGHKLLKLGARYQLRAPNGWDTMSHLQVLGYSVGESIHSISIRSTRRSCIHPQIRIKILEGRRIVHISLPQLDVICLLKIKKWNY